MFDYIIIGAGSAGCVIANRLSANGKKRVCLIEAGPPDRNPLIHIPMGLALIQRVKSIQWGHHTVEETQLNNRRLYWPRGKTLGGSSSINAMIYMRGHRADYDAWAEAAGQEWAWTRVEPLFKRMEHFEEDSLHHGQNGPLHVCKLRTVNAMTSAFIAAGKACGLSENLDFNGDTQDGVGLYHVTHKNGARHSAAKAFLDPIKNRKNLDIISKAQVLRVVFSNKFATGVMLQERTIALNKGGEVILCAGAVNSPHILMHSGLGPVETLKSFGLDVVHDAPDVGQNLADHLDIAVQALDRSKHSIGISAPMALRGSKALIAFLARHQGELTSNIAEAGGFARSDGSQDRPNLQFHFVPALQKDHGRSLAMAHGVTLHVCDLLPKSRGRISLQTNDPRSHPRIEANYLSHEQDVITLLNGLKLARSIMAAEPLARHLSRTIHPAPSCLSDDELIADIRARAETIYHPVGTCRMGLDSRAVTDTQGRVYGVNGLRVVDASLMPNIIAGNTNAPTMMMAENIADMMLNV